MKQIIVILLFFKLNLFNAQIRWDSLLVEMNTPDCYMVNFDLYYNRKHIDLLDGKSEWYLIVEKEKEEKIEKVSSVVGNVFRLCKGKNEKLTMVLKRGKKCYEFPLFKLGEVGGVWVYTKWVDKTCLNCYWNMREKLIFWLKGWVRLDTLKRVIRIRIYDDFFRIDGTYLSSWYNIDPVSHSGFYYTKEEFRRKNDELRILIESYKRKNAILMESKKKRK